MSHPRSAHQNRQQRHRENSSHCASRTLDQIRPGERASISGHRAQGAVRQRLLDLGLHPKVEVTMVRAAPLGDPIELKLDASLIALRRTEAVLIDVHP